MGKLIMKYNSSLGAILCSLCRKILKTGKVYTEEEAAYSRGEIKDLPEQYCDTCKLLVTDSK